MDTQIEEAIGDCNDRNPSQTKHCGNVRMLGQQPVHSEDTHARHKSAGTSGSPTTSVQKGCNEKIEPSTLIFWTSSEALAPPPGVSAAAVDEEAGVAQERATPRRWKSFCSRWLTAYRVLGAGIMVINLATLSFQVHSSSAVDVFLTATAANITAAVLMRQEDVINLSFKAASRLPLTLPLALRSMVGDLHHYGGVHVGCALSALMWYIAFTAFNTVRVLDFVSRDNMTTILYVDVITAYTALLVILTICITAIPRLRARCHNTFEATHRFGGWTALVVLWIHGGISTLSPDVSQPLYSHASLWLILLTTLLLILPWLRIRRVPITIHPLSAREVQLTFPYARMPYTSTLRTSTSPLTEWHAFATIPLSSTSAGLLVSQAGDWTRSLIASPPSHLWIRHPPTLNFLALAPLFASLLLVATGAGVGPLLSLLASHHHHPINPMRPHRRNVRVMWCVAAPEAPHWAPVLAAIHAVDADAVVFDSRAGRPDVAFEARELAVSEALEAVMVVSNPRVTRDVVRGCKAVGVAAYGAVFDS